VGEKEARADIFTVEAVDTTGAGDSYAAGFLYGYVRDWPLEKSVRLASRVAAQAVSQLGAVVRDRTLLSEIVVEISA
jgi:1-phosphofructokinase